MTGVEALRGLERPPKVFVAATGAGAGIQASLWSVPGSSAFLAGAAFPYAAHETERLLGFRPERFCDEDRPRAGDQAVNIRFVDSGATRSLAWSISGPPSAPTYSNS